MWKMSHKEYDYDAEHAKARINVDNLDELDGWEDRELGTILAALDSGLRQDISCAFEALVMLEDLVLTKKK